MVSGAVLMNSKNKSNEQSNNKINIKVHLRNKTITFNNIFRSKLESKFI